MDVTIKDNSDKVLEAFRQQLEAALEAIGNQAVSHAKQSITEAGRVDTGALRNSISHQVEMGEDSVYIGTNQSYAQYHEFGTGIYADGGGGRQTPWFYVDAHGDGHWTRGVKPVHFLKNAVADHQEEYGSIAESILKNN